MAEGRSKDCNKFCGAWRRAWRRRRRGPACSRTGAPGVPIAPGITRGRLSAATRRSARRVSAPPSCLGRARSSRQRGSRPRAAGPIRPVHAVQPVCPGSPHPEEDRGRDDLEFPGNLPEGCPPTNQRHHFPATLLSPVFLAMAVTLREWLTAMLPHRYCSTIADTWPLIGKGPPLSPLEAAKAPVVG